MIACQDFCHLQVEFSWHANKMVGCQDNSTCKEYKIVYEKRI